MDTKKPVKYSKHFSLDELNTIAHVLLPIIKQARVVALHGPLGAGKTTLVQAIAQQLGVIEALTSPTFTYVSQYKLPENGLIYHFDLYRLSSINSFYEAGFDEMLEDQNALVCIEWPEVIAALLPSNTCHIYLSYNDTDLDKRIITVV